MFYKKISTIYYRIVFKIMFNLCKIMFKFIKVFDKHSEYLAEKGNFDLPNVSFCIDDKDVHYNPLDFSKQYLTFVGTERPTTFKFSGNGISYSLDEGKTWVALASNTDSPSIGNGEKIMWKGEMTPNTWVGIGTFSAIVDGNIDYGTFNIEGNVMSLLYGDNFVDKVDLSGKGYAFSKLFHSNERIISAKNMKLPATTLAGYCYYGMFWNCTSLSTAPELPATTLANYCYQGMFNGCTSLTTAPKLPAETLATYCYSNMFNGCTKLTTAPSLPATTLTQGCYSNMFQGCTKLTTAPSLPATTLAVICYHSMFSGCTLLTTAPELPATTLLNGCYNNMFEGCTSLTTAPSLPATTLATNCYSSMFSACASLNYIKAMFTTEPSETYTKLWVDGVASTGTFVKNSAAQWDVSGVNGVPTGWTVETA